MATTSSPSTESGGVSAPLMIATVAVLVGLLPLPYGYYTLLRLFLCGLALYLLVQLSPSRAGERWVLGGLAVLYNPVLPVRLGDKGLWIAVNVVTLAVFWFISRSGRTVAARQ